MMMLQLPEKQAKMKCSYIIISFSVVMNLILLVIVALEGNILFKGSEMNRSKHYELLEKGMDSLENSTRSLDIHFQEFKRKLTNSYDTTTHMVVYINTYELDMLTNVEILGVKNTIGSIHNLLYKLLKDTNLDEPTKSVDEIKTNVKLIKQSSHLLMLSASKQIEANSFEEDSREDNSSVMGFSNVQTENVQPSLLVSDPLVVEEASEINTYQYVYEDYEDLYSHESTSQGKRFKIFDVQVNWTEALNKCEAEDMQLASITSSAEQTEVVKLISDADLGHADFWLAGNDLEVSGRFIWVKSGRPMTYANWNTGEPNNAWAVSGNEQEHCTSLVYDFSYRWNDSLCSSQKYYICEELREQTS